jgi:hypothetical protein
VKKIVALENQVKYYKGSEDVVSKFIKEFLEEDKLNENIRKDFIANVLELQEVNLKLSIFYNENIIFRNR